MRHTAGHLVALNWTMKNIYNVDPGDVFWAASDVGWVVGHSYICYAPLIHGNTTVVFEGKPVGTPDAGTFWRVIAEHNVRSFFTAPTAFRAVKREDPKGELSRNTISPACARSIWRANGPTPTRSNGRRNDWACRSTITGGRPKPAGPSRATPPGSKRCRSRSARPPWRCPAMTCRFSTRPATECPRRTGRDRDQTAPAARHAADALERRGPLQQILSDHFPGYYETGDAGMIDEDGYLYIMARTDDVINVAGHRLSTGAMEEVLAGHPDVAECAVIGVTDELKGQCRWALSA